MHVRAFGLFGVHIEQADTTCAEIQARKFLLKVVGTRSDYTRDELISFMRAKILEYVPNLLANHIIREKIGVLKLSAYLTDFSKAIYDELVGHFDSFGLTLDNFSFHNINVPDADLEIINQAKIQRKTDQIKAEGAAVKMDIESAARARMREREGYTFQQEQSFNVLKSAAENEGTASNLMGAGMGLGMGFGVGGAFQTGMGNVIQNAMPSREKPQEQSSSATASVKKCPNCGAENAENAKFCLNCGEKFTAAELVCPECGQKLTPGAKFCINCGHRITASCPTCGAKVAPGAKFCPECGTKL